MIVRLFLVFLIVRVREEPRLKETKMQFSVKKFRKSNLVGDSSEWDGHTHWASLQKLNELVSNDAGRR